MRKTRYNDPEFIEAVARVLALLPEDLVSVTVGFGQFDSEDIAIQAWTQAQVKILRTALPVRKWEKQNTTGTWRYTGEVYGLTVKVYGCQEAPPTCRLVDKTEVVTEMVPVRFEMREVEVPVAFEERQVERTVQVWDCK